MYNDFVNDKVYENVYMIFVDACGHSDIVKNNTKDKSNKGLDLLEEVLVRRLNYVKDNNRCATASVWTWLGDGGIFVFHDTKEQAALKSALEFAMNVIKIDLQTLNLEFKNAEINGELHLRIAVHKGTIKYKEEGRNGSIHSVDLNWGTHLEKATLQDTISISREIYDILEKKEKKQFQLVGEFEDKKIYIYNNSLDSSKVKFSWVLEHGFKEMESIQSYYQRISQEDKAYLIKLSQKKVIDFGTTLNTCSGYLSSTARPVPYRDAVIDLLNRKGEFYCYMLNPGSIGANQLKELRNEDTDTKLKTSLERLKKFNDKNNPITENFHVCQMDYNPNFAAMFFDPDSEDAICLFSPYFNISPEGNIGEERADMPHYIIGKKNRIYSYVWDYVNSYIKNSKKVL